MSAAVCAKANRTLATLLGWTSIVSVGSGTLLGTPPGGVPNCRGQAAVPDWCGSWDACGPMMVRQACFPELGLLQRGMVYVMRAGEPLGCLVVADYPSLDQAVRTAIVFAVINRLSRRARAALVRSAA